METTKLNMTAAKEPGSCIETKKIDLYDKIAIGVAEFLGTAILVFVACMGCNKTAYGGEIAPLQAAFSSGLAVLIVIHLFAHISGAHVNPMSTVCALILGEISLSLVPFYFAGEISGSVVGYGLVRMVTPVWHMYGLNETNDNFTGFCTTLPSADLSVGEALGVEMVITMILVFANCSAWDKRNSGRTDSVSIRFGFLVSTICMIANPLTGASMNPARSFGPAFWNNYWENHWIYWVGPLTSAVIGSSFYRFVFMRKKPKLYLDDTS